MAMTKYNLVRVRHLLAMLKENRYPNFPRFMAEMKRLDPAGAYKLSARTLLRDIEFLKSQYGAPIQYDCSQRGYYLSVPEWNIDIPVLEDSEMRAAVLGARLAENIMPAPVRQIVRHILNEDIAARHSGPVIRAI